MNNLNVAFGFFLLVVSEFDMANSIYKACDKEVWKWCEQSRCTDSCQCQFKKVCKQVCSDTYCPSLQCIATKACSQSIIPPATLAFVKRSKLLVTPKIENLTAVSTNIEQDCSRGYCKLMAAVKVRGIPSQALQVCVDGQCDEIVSNVDQTRQLAENTNLMQCHGSSARSCDQVCVLGKCKTMYCNARECKQRCSMGSECAMVCGEKVTNCFQMCELNSNCTMACLGTNCIQNCTGASCDTAALLPDKNSTLEFNTTTDKNLFAELLSTVPTETMGADGPVMKNSTSLPFLNGTTHAQQNKSAQVDITNNEVEEVSSNTKILLTNDAKYYTNTLHSAAVKLKTSKIVFSSIFLIAILFCFLL